MTTAKIPRVTGGESDPGILYELLGDLVDTTWFKPLARRRGRLVHAGAHLLAQKQEIDPAWWDRHSGEGDDDLVEHESCRPYIQGAEKALGELGLTVIEVEKRVENPLERYVGHYDWLCEPEGPQTTGYPNYTLIDLKCGNPPTRGSITEHMHRYQLALYKLAIAVQNKWIVKRAALYLPGDGNYKLVRYDDASDMNRALILARAYHIRRDADGSNASN